MAIKWRASGAVDISVSGDIVTVAQAIEVYDEADVGTVLSAETVSGKRNIDRMKANPTPELRAIIDGEIITAATAACRAAKTSVQADGFAAAADAYIATVQAAQAGV